MLKSKQIHLFIHFQHIIDNEMELNVDCVKLTNVKMISVKQFKRESCDSICCNFLPRIFTHEVGHLSKTIMHGVYIIKSKFRIFPLKCLNESPLKCRIPRYWYDLFHNLISTVLKPIVYSHRLFVRFCRQHLKSGTKKETF